MVQGMAVSRLVIYPYKMASRSAKILAAKVSTVIGKRVRRVRETGKYSHKLRSIILNWGNGRLPSWWRNTRGVPTGFMNLPMSVRAASDKLHPFRTF